MTSAVGWTIPPLRAIDRRLRKEVDRASLRSVRHFVPTPELDLLYPGNAWGVQVKSNLMPEPLYKADPQRVWQHRLDVC